MKVAWISTFRTQCGLATYIESLYPHLAKLVDLKIFAEKIFPPFEEVEPLPQNRYLQSNYERCWDRREFYNGNYEALKKAVIDYSPDVVHLNFVAGMFGELSYNPQSPFQKFVSDLRSKDIKIVITLHDIPLSFPSPVRLSEWYKNLHAKFLVFNPDTVTALKQWCSRENIFMIPHATWAFEPHDKSEARKRLGLKDESFLLTQVGFYDAGKGMMELISAFPKILETIPNAKLVFAGGILKPIEDFNRIYIGECLKLAVKLNLTDKIIFVGKYLSEEEINLWCSASDFLLLNAKMVWAYSTSGSVHRIIGSGKPILMADNPRLSEFTDGVNCFKMNDETITEKVINLYGDIGLQQKISQGILDYSKKTSFEITAKRYVEELYK